LKEGPHEGVAALIDEFADVGAMPPQVNLVLVSLYSAKMRKIRPIEMRRKASAFDCCSAASSRLLQGDVSGADVGGGEDGEERHAWNGGFDVCSTALFAVYQTEDAGYVHACLAGGFDGGNGGAAGGADVVHDNNVCAGFEEAFDAAACAVSFFCFADEEAMDEGGDGTGVFVGFELEGAGEFGDLVAVGKSPCTSAGGVGDEWVGAHGESAYSFDLVCVGDVFADEVVEDETGEATAFGVEGSDAAVDVVVGLLAAGEGEVT